MDKPEFDVAEAHRWFAIECNNRAWDLVESESRSEEEREELLMTASSAAWHWKQIGKPLNNLRAQVLLATAAIVADDESQARRSVANCLQLLTEIDDVPDFDLACTHAVSAASARMDGNLDESKQHFVQFDKLAAKLDEESQKLLSSLYRK
ncbi:hypothetical protein KOR42_00570 [Thalassoglobus neptunius]|uniref:Uncharacterized protein n=1 Tax=Thalassoglobus neptunius TaxID=1938619 RepID=A0A5C5X3C9_9PLAN|nr:hypothetical protein [Thalassoglobus neptunius]TWT56703.1 hypothetical protein KOR42_00570 [Thalassoglobus neptunius]